MLITTQVEIHLTSKNIDYYHGKGYTGEKGHIITISTEDLSPSSSVKVLYQCDYPGCGEMHQLQYCDLYQKRAQKYAENKDYCAKHCCAIRKQWMLANEPELYKMANKLRCEKTKKTIQQKYGVDNIMQTSVGQENFKAAMTKKYGQDNPMKVPEIREHLAQSMVESHPELETVGQENGSIYYRIHGVPCSKNQKYLADLFQGELNSLISGYYLDILLDDQIYFEYNGQGHKLSIALHHATEEQFTRREIQRYYVLKQKGYKQIVFESQHHRILPSDDILLSIIQTAKDYFALDSQHHWIVFDYDAQNIRVKHKTIPYSFDAPICIDDLIQVDKNII